MLQTITPSTLIGSNYIKVYENKTNINSSSTMGDKSNDRVNDGIVNLSCSTKNISSKTGFLYL